MLGVPLRGLDPSGFSIANLAIADGRRLTANDHRRVLLGTGLARSLGIQPLAAQPGQTVTIEGTVFEVVGVFESNAVLETATAVASLREVQELMDRPGRVSEFQIRVVRASANETALEGLGRQIEELRDARGEALGLRAIPSREFADTDTETRLAAGTAWATSIIAMGLSFVGMMNTMLMSVLERRREVAVLRAVGWARARVLRMIVGESIILSLVGAVAGVAGAFALVRALSQWSPTLSIVPPNLSSLAIGVGVLLALASGAAGAFYPAFWAATVDPLEALHAE